MSRAGESTAACLQAVAALLADGQVWRLRDIVSALPEFSPEKVRMTVSNDCQKYFIWVSYGHYRLAAQHLRPALRSRREIAREIVELVRQMLRPIAETYTDRWQQLRELVAKYDKAVD